MYNPPELVKRGYETWRLQGRKPEKHEVEALDLFWDRDLNTIAHIVRYLQDIGEFEGGGEPEQEFGF